MVKYIRLLSFLFLFCITSMVTGQSMKGGLRYVPNQEHILVIKLNQNNQSTESRGIASENLVEDYLANQLEVDKVDILNVFDTSSPEVLAFEEKVNHSSSRKTAANDFSFGNYKTIKLTGKSNEELLQIAQQLEEQSFVSFVDLVALTPPPPPSDIAPTTDDMTARQRHLGADPGINAKYAWDLGIKGKGVKIGDIEYDVNRFHEEWADQDKVIYAEGLTPIQTQWGHGHGTAVAGIMVAQHNGYGMNGIVPDADKFILFAEASLEADALNGTPYNRAFAMQKALTQLDAGDVFLLEIQTYGSGGVQNAERYVPGEYEKAVWDITRAATDAGIIVVATGGNGTGQTQTGENLDAPQYKSYRDRGHSGAIMVGAGSSNTQHHKLGYSTYGSRFDLQGWGQGVATTGEWNGDIKVGGDENQAYVYGFGGTSAAGPIVASAVVAVQSFSKERLGKIMTANEIRDLLIATGTPQYFGEAEHIGPLPDLKKAFQKLLSDNAIGISILDITGGNNNDEFLDKGETATFDVEVFNHGNSAMNNLSVVLAIDGTNVTATNNSLTIANIPANSSKKVTFEITADNNIVNESTVKLNVTVNLLTVSKTITVAPYPKLVWSNNSLNEAVTNNGTIANDDPIIIELISDEFKIDINEQLREGIDFTISNLPNRLNAVFTVTEANKLALTITGMTLNHDNADDIDNLAIEILPAALKNSTSTFNNSANTLTIDFKDEYQIVYIPEPRGVGNGNMVANASTPWGYSFLEYADNSNNYAAGGTNTGIGVLYTPANRTLEFETYQKRCITKPNTKDLKRLGNDYLVTPQDTWEKAGNYVGAMFMISRDEFTEWRGQADYFGFEFTHNGNKVMAWVKASVNNNGTEFILDEYAYNSTPGGTIRTGQTTIAATVSYEIGQFTESDANDGSIGNTVLINLSNDTFKAATGQLDAADYTISGLPAGLTLVVNILDNKHLELVLNGKASNHNIADNTANVQFNLNDSAFSSGNGSEGNSNNFEILFKDEDAVLGTDKSLNNLSVYPNPTNGSLNIKSSLPILAVNVFDISGINVLSNNNNNISLASLAPGIYNVIITTKEGNKHFKVIRK